MPAERDILIVEDNPADVRLMREALRDLQPVPVVEVASEAHGAWRTLNDPEKRKPRLILLDFNLPGSGSQALLEKVKADEALRMIPVCVLTTSDAEPDIAAAYRLHANCFLCKPSDLDGFLTLIRSTVNFWLTVACTAIPSK